MLYLRFLCFALGANAGASFVSPIGPSELETESAVFESLGSTPVGWTKQHPAHPDLTINLRIGLKQGNFDALELHLFEVSTPDNPRYGQHLSQDHVNALVAPSQESLGAVTSWLGEHGLGALDIEHSPAKDWVHLRVPVSTAERLLDAKYHV